MVKIKIPAALQAGDENLDLVEVESKSLLESLVKVIKKYPELKDKLYNEQGSIKKYIRFYINQKMIDLSELDKCFLAEGDTIYIVAPVAGG